MTVAAVLAIGRPTFDLDLGAAAVAAAWALLVETGAELSGEPDVVTDDVDPFLRTVASTAPDVVVILQATFADSSLVRRIVDRTGLPILIWSFPEARTGGRLRLNSLCGANLAAYLLRRRGDRAGFVHIDPAQSDALDVVGAEIARLVEPPAPERRDMSAGDRRRVADPGDLGRQLVESLVGLRIGIVGEPPVGFEPCLGDDAELTRATGFAVERIPLGELFVRADAVTEEERSSIDGRVRGTMAVDDEVVDAGMEQSVRLFGGLDGLARERGWGALATRCWPECMTEYGGAACTPMAMLTEDGVPSVCEADVYGAATALVLHRVSGTDPFVADLVDADHTDNTSVVWHCGVASSRLADPDTRPVAITHPNRKRALANQFALRSGRVTIARLSQSSGELSLVIGTGELLQRPRAFQGTCGVLRWDRPLGEVLDTVFGRGLEHHLGIVYGDHANALQALASAWGLPVVQI